VDGVGGINMDIKSIKELLVSMSDSDVNYLEIESEGLHITLKKEVQYQPTSKDVMEVSNAKIIEVKRNQENSKDYVEEIQNLQVENKKNESIPLNIENEKLITVTSPIVGTFYKSSGPNSEPFIKVGQKIKKGEVLCIIEAMKLMNEIECEVDGEVVEIIASNEQLVEYGQPLLKIKI
jgi:acetyl-CoA carboxylase biotin carboxyl carrier protein